jgi:hypothetical protein
MSSNRPARTKGVDGTPATVEDKYDKNRRPYDIVKAFGEFEGHEKGADAQFCEANGVMQKIEA